jgi:hypothetical protein
MTISTVTICFNNLAELQRTCAAVDQQLQPPFEHWIINGSTGNHIAAWLLETPQPAYRKWLNERDNGIADAFNKGIERAAGEVIHLLNSGDVYADAAVLQDIQAFWQQHPAVQWTSGKVKTFRGGHWVTVGKPFDAGKLYRGMRSVSHPSWFVRKAVYQRHGGYSSTYKIAMDYDMMCRIATEPYAYMDREVAVFDPTGVSSNQYDKALAETRTVYESHFGYSVKMVAWQLRLKLLHVLLQSALGKWLFNLKRKAGLENA